MHFNVNFSVIATFSFHESASTNSLDQSPLSHVDPTTFNYWWRGVQHPRSSLRQQRSFHLWSFRPESRSRWLPLRSRYGPELSSLLHERVLAVLFHPVDEVLLPSSAPHRVAPPPAPVSNPTVEWACGCCRVDYRASPRAGADGLRLSCEVERMGTSARSLACSMEETTS